MKNIYDLWRAAVKFSGNIFIWVLKNKEAKFLHSPMHYLLHASQTLFMLTVFGRVSMTPGGGRGGGGGTPIYGLYRYVPQDRVWFLRFSVLK